MPEKCSAYKKYNKIASGIRLVFYSSDIAMMHGPINIGLKMFHHGQDYEQAKRNFKKDNQFQQHLLPPLHLIVQLIM